MIEYLNQFNDIWWLDLIIFIILMLSIWIFVDAFYKIKEKHDANQ